MFQETNQAGFEEHVANHHNMYVLYPRFVPLLLLACSCRVFVLLVAGVGLWDVFLLLDVLLLVSHTTTTTTPFTLCCCAAADVLMC
jgi:hypothetical protein